MIELHAFGVPSPQGSKTGYVVNGRAVLVEGRAAPARATHKAWRESVRIAAVNYLATNPRPQLDEPLKVHIDFRFAPTTDRYRTRHASKPDVDKLARTVLDSLTDSGLIRNDSQVWDLHVTKLYCRGGESPGAIIRITPDGEREAVERQALKDEARMARQTVRSQG